jgi:hypothetical protein
MMVKQKRKREADEELGEAFKILVANSLTGEDVDWDPSHVQVAGREAQTGVWVNHKHLRDALKNENLLPPGDEADALVQEMLHVAKLFEPIAPARPSRGVAASAAFTNGAFAFTTVGGAPVKPPPPPPPLPTARCPCGNVFLDDSVFCRKCGTARPPDRPQPPPPSQAGGYEIENPSSSPTSGVENPRAEVSTADRAEPIRWGHASGVVCSPPISTPVPVHVCQDEATQWADQGVPPQATPEGVSYRAYERLMESIAKPSENTQEEVDRLGNRGSTSSASARPPAPPRPPARPQELPLE